MTSLILAVLICCMIYQSLVVNESVLWQFGCLVKMETNMAIEKRDTFCASTSVWLQKRLFTSKYYTWQKYTRAHGSILMDRAHFAPLQPNCDTDGKSGIVMMPISPRARTQGITSLSLTLTLDRLFLLTHCLHLLIAVSNFLKSPVAQLGSKLRKTNKIPQRNA